MQAARHGRWTMRVRIGILFCLVGGLLQFGSAADVEFKSALIKLNKIQDRELLSVSRFDSAGWDFKPVAENLEISDEMIVGIYLEFYREDLSMSMYPQQVFLRFTHVESGEFVDFIAKKRSSQVVAEVNLTEEAKEDTFWKDGEVYGMDIIIGDKLIEGARTWNVCSNVTVRLVITPPTPAPGVFDFDLSVKKDLQPEFAFPRDSEMPTAPSIIVVLFSVLVVLPFIGMFIIFAKLGALPPKFPTNSPAAIVFQLSLLAVCGVLIQFWLATDFISTSKYIALLAIPLIPSGYYALCEVESASRTTVDDRPKAE